MFREDRLLQGERHPFQKTQRVYPNSQIAPLIPHEPINRVVLIRLRVQDSGPDPGGRMT